MSAAWMVTLACWGILAVIWGRSRPSWLWYVKPIVAFIGAGAFARTDWGRTVAGWLRTAAGWATGLIGVGGATLLGIAVLIAFVYIVLELAAERRANSGVLIAICVLPILAGIAAGTVAGAVNNGYGHATAGATGAVARLVGG